MKLDAKGFFLPEWSFEKRNNRLLVWKKTVGSGRNSKPFLLPDKIEFDENLAEFVGLYLGDGKTTENDLTHAQFQTKDFDLAQKTMKAFYYLGVKDSDVTFTLTYREKGIKEAERMFQTIAKKIRMVKSERHNFPCYSIQVNGKIFRIFLKNFLMGSLVHIKNESRLRRAFLKGYFAAEGYIGYSNQEHYIVSVGFSYNPKTESWLRDFCVECLNLEGVDSRIKFRHEEHNGQIIITNWENYYKLWKLGVFEGCERKKSKFLKIFCEVRITCKIDDKMRQNLFSGNQYELADKLGTYQASISNMKTGSKRNMWPTIEQVIKLSKLQNIELNDTKKSITKIRFGSSTVLEGSDEILNDTFNLKSPSS